METKTSIPCFMNGEMIQFPHSFSILMRGFRGRREDLHISLERSKLEI